MAEGGEMFNFNINCFRYIIYFLIFHHSKILFRISLYPPSALRAPSPTSRGRQVIIIYFRTSNLGSTHLWGELPMAEGGEMFNFNINCFRYIIYFLIFHHSKILFRISLYPPSALRAPSPASRGRQVFLKPLISRRQVIIIYFITSNLGSTHLWGELPKAEGGINAQFQHKLPQVHYLCFLVLHHSKSE